MTMTWVTLTTGNTDFVALAGWRTTPQGYLVAEMAWDIYTDRLRGGGLEPVQNTRVVCGKCTRAMRNFPSAVLGDGRRLTMLIASPSGYFTLA